ncbi:hypothetical protein LP419_23890 [Massilia sp. H-1]|nr:hypothetical protein LP419_23890 [Massilia sp. H-1]
MRISSLCLAAACLFGAVVVHAAELPPVEQFFDNPRFGGAVLSPDGKSLALRVASKGTRERLAVLDIATNKAKVVAEFADVDVADIDWISDKRLVLNTRDRRWTPGGARYAPGMYAVNSDGSNFLQLVTRTQNLSNDSGRAAAVVRPQAESAGQAGFRVRLHGAAAVRRQLPERRLCRPDPPEHHQRQDRAGAASGKDGALAARRRA